MDFSDLKDKRALVTAGAAGIGRAIVENLVECGAKVAVGQRDSDKLQDLVEKHSGAVHGFPVDISEPAQCRRLVKDAVGALGGIDILVNNAAVTGVSAARWFLDEDDEHIDQIIDVNLKGTIHVSLAAAKQMHEQGSGGVIIHISSIGAFGAQQAGSIYCASKAAISGLTQAMALELAQHDIRVVAVAPGDIRIEASSDVATKIDSLKVDQTLVPKTPLHLGEPQDIGTVVTFLASNNAKFVTGTTWVVDGGYLSY